MEVTNGEFYIILELLVLIGAVFYITTNKAVDALLKEYEFKCVLLKVGDQVTDDLLSTGIFKYVENGPRHTKMYKYKKEHVDKKLVKDYNTEARNYRARIFADKKYISTEIFIYAQIVHNVTQLCEIANLDLPKDLLTSKITSFIKENIVNIANLPSCHKSLFDLIHTYETLLEYCRYTYGDEETSLTTSACKDILILLEKSSFKYIKIDK